MVAIFTGLGAGFERGSASVLGAGGIIGGSVYGRGGEAVSINAATGNLVIAKQDEFLVGRGPDVGVSRTYNGLGLVPDENGDKWRFSYDRRVFGLTGTEKTAGSTIKRLSADGSEILYSWDATKSAYVTKDGGGSYDTLVKSGADWVWTDGDSRVTERYLSQGTTNGTASFRLVYITDADGNQMYLSYTADNKLTGVTTADGAYVEYVWTGNNITQLNTVYTDLAAGGVKTLVRTRYSYDASNRLATVTVDLSPENGSVADGKTYVTTYSYDASGRVATLSQSDGSLLAISYDAAGRVASLVETAAVGVTRATSLSYGVGATTITHPNGSVTVLNYDSDGKLVRTTSGAVTQNLLVRSEEFNSWYTAGTVVANDTTHAAPDGTWTAEKVTLTGGGGASIQQFLSVANTGCAAGINAVADIWVYSETSQDVTWAIYDNILGHRYTTTLVAGQWTRLRQIGNLAANSTDRRVQLWRQHHRHPPRCAGANRR